MKPGAESDSELVEIAGVDLFPIRRGRTASRWNFPSIKNNEFRIMWLVSAGSLPSAPVAGEATVSTDSCVFLSALPCCVKKCLIVSLKLCSKSVRETASSSENRHDLLLLSSLKELRVDAALNFGEKWIYDGLI